jgi:hypothetical protein
VKKSLENRIRGWFPTDPAFRTGNANTEKSNIRIRKGPPTLRERAVGGLGAAGGVLTLSAVVFYFVPIYPKQAVTILLIAGIPLLIAAIIVNRTAKKSQN